MCLYVVLVLGYRFDTLDECKYGGDNRSLVCVNTGHKLPVV